MVDLGLGQTIRDARVRRGITVEQLSSVTKISPAILRAMEAEDFDRLPGGVFARGFFRSYAREVGLAPEDVVAMYVAQVGGGTAAARAEPEMPAAESVADADEGPPASERSSDLGQMILIAIIVA